jgi:hypothetical protein
MAKPPKKNAGDIAHGTAKAGLSLIPFVGGAAAELFNLVLAPPLERRRNEWMDSVTVKLQELEARLKDFDLEHLAENESFVTAILHATRVAVQTHQGEKLKALRNAVLNAALPDAPDDDVQAMLLSYIEDMTPWHLRTLSWLKDPDEWAQAHGKLRHNLAALNFMQMFQLDFPELKGQSDFVVQVVNDLRSRGLITEDTSSRTSLGRDMHGPRTTGFGESFLSYISSPPIG